MQTRCFASPSVLTDARTVENSPIAEATLVPVTLPVLQPAPRAPSCRSSMLVQHVQADTATPCTRKGSLTRQREGWSFPATAVIKLQIAAQALQPCMLRAEGSHCTVCSFGTGPRKVNTHHLSYLLLVPRSGLLQLLVFARPAFRRLQ
jgi:hypothetical protein